MAYIRKILSSKYCEIFTITLCLYSTVFLLLSFISVSIESSSKNIIIIESCQDEIKLEDISKNLENITLFDQDLTINKPPVESLSVPNIVESPSVSLESVENLINHDQTHDDILSIDNLTEKIDSGNSNSQQVEVGGVLDRLTVEIINAASNHELNVIWLFDASISLSKQRSDIKNRFAKIFEEISYDNSSSNRVKHTIASFGVSCNILSESPSNDLLLLTNSIDSIKLDQSGIENVFGSIEKLCQKYKSYKNIIIVFTDEIGDDINLLDKAIFEARKQGTAIYVVGPPAPFGLEKIQFKYIDPDPKYDQTEKWVEINQGPETLYKMTLDLHSLDCDEHGIDSGFGPYSLNKLCIDTGGIYFSVHANRKKNTVSKKQISPLSSYISVFFDYNIMKQYSPDYRNILLQNKELQNNKTKQALLQACKIPVYIKNDQKMYFTAFNEGDFVEQLNEAQKFSAKIEPKLDQVYNILKEVESSAKHLTEKRWIISYNLAMGRILATKCRIESYNLMLAEAKLGLKKNDKKNNTWSIEHTKEFNIKSSNLQKYHESAQRYLQFIVDNFPNTPWSYIAKAELDTPMGYKWIEGYKEQKKQTMGNGNNNQPAPRKDDIKKQIEYKPQRNISKI